MNTPDSIDSAIRRLTLAVWVLAGLVAVNICVSLFDFRMGFPIINPFTAFSSGPTTTITMTPPPITSGSTMASRTFEVEDRLNGFHDWPLQKQIDEASVVAVVRFNKQGNRYKCVVSEILKKAPGTTFYYRVGDEYEKLGMPVRENTVYGDGEIVFFTGSPAMMRYACTFDGDRIGAFGDMPFEEFRKMMKK